MVYDEEGAQAPKHIVLDISGGSYYISSSTDDNLKPKKQDERPILKTGDSGVFDFYSYITECDIFAAPASLITSYLHDESGSAVYKIRYNYTDHEGTAYPLEGELWLNINTKMPNKLVAAYIEFPDAVKSRIITVDFSGTSVSDCHISRFHVVYEGMFLIFKYKMNERKTFNY